MKQLFVLIKCVVLKVNCPETKLLFVHLIRDDAYFATCKSGHAVKHELASDQRVDIS